MSQYAVVVTESSSAPVHAPTPFRALDPELPGLAARAAFQLDNLRLRAEGRTEVTAKQDAIAQLAARLQTVSTAWPTGDQRTLLDPVTTGVLHGAVLQAHQQTPQSMSDVLAQVGRLAEQLVKIEGFETKVDCIVALRDFCLAVSDLSASKQHLIRSPRPYRVPAIPRA